MSCLFPFFHGLKGLTETERDAEGGVKRGREKEGIKKRRGARETDNSEKDIRGMRIKQ